MQPINFQGKLKAFEELDKLINKSIWLGKVRPKEGDPRVSFIAQAEFEGNKCYLIFVKHKGTPPKFHSISDGDLERFLYKE